jgi:hypothetical protein
MATGFATATIHLAASEDDGNSDRIAQSSAVDRLLNITELVESILLQLPCLDLLRAQSVCRSWHAIVNGGRRIQTALFLKPSGPVLDKGKLLLSSSNPDAVIRVRPFLIKIINPLCPREARAEKILDGMNTCPEGASTSNVFAVAGALFSSYTDAEGGKAYQTCVDRLNSFPTGMFRRMFVTQPPTSQVVLGRLPSALEKKDVLTELDIGLITWTTPKENGRRHRIRFPREGRTILNNPEGVTMGQLVDHFASEPPGEAVRYFHFFGNLRKVQSGDEGTAAPPEE